jgi:hypothetical protein
MCWQGIEIALNGWLTEGLTCIVPVAHAAAAVPVGSFLRLVWPGKETTLETKTKRVRAPRTRLQTCLPSRLEMLVASEAARLETSVSEVLRRCVERVVVTTPEGKQTLNVG